MSLQGNSHFIEEVQRVSHLTQFTQLIRNGGTTMELSSLLSNPRLHLPLKKSLFPGSERFFPDHTGGCFCHNRMVGGVQGISRPEGPAEILSGWDPLQWNIQVWFSKPTFSLFAFRKELCWNICPFIGSLHFSSSLFCVSQWHKGLFLMGVLNCFFQPGNLIFS